MNFTLFTVFAYIFILFSWSRGFLRYRDGSISLSELGFWSLVWVCAFVTIAQPKLSAVLADNLGIGRGADAIVYLSIIILFYLLFRMYIKMGMVERELTRLVRALALQEAKRKN